MLGASGSGRRIVGVARDTRMTMVNWWDTVCGMLAGTKAIVAGASSDAPATIASVKTDKVGDEEPAI